MREIKQIVLHCSASPNGKDFDIKDCDAWHAERGFQRQDSWRCGFNPTLFHVGYHFWIKTDGKVQTGRQVDEVGAHVSGMNSTSLGICMCGTDKFTPAQWNALSDLVSKLQLTYPNAKIIGHYDTPTGQSQGKTCPNFNVVLWLAQRMEPDSSHVAAVATGHEQKVVG